MLHTQASLFVKAVVQDAGPAGVSSGMMFLTPGPAGGSEDQSLFTFSPLDAFLSPSASACQNTHGTHRNLLFAPVLLRAAPLSQLG